MLLRSRRMTQVCPPSVKSAKPKAAAISLPQGSTTMGVLDKNNGIGGIINTEKVTGIVQNGDSNNNTGVKSEPKSSPGNQTPLCVPQMAASVPLSDDGNSPAPSFPPFNNSNDPTGHYEQGKFQFKLVAIRYFRIPQLLPDLLLVEC